MLLELNTVNKLEELNFQISEICSPQNPCVELFDKGDYRAAVKQLGVSLDDATQPSCEQLWWILAQLGLGELPPAALASFLDEKRETLTKANSDLSVLFALTYSSLAVRILKQGQSRLGSISLRHAFNFVKQTEELDEIFKASYRDAFLEIIQEELSQSKVRKSDKKYTASIESEIAITKKIKFAKKIARKRGKP